MGGVEVPQAPRGWEVGRGYPPLHWGRVWGGSCAPSPENFSYFYSSLITNVVDTFNNIVENTVF